MPGVVYRFMSDDHDRLDALMERSVASPGVIDMEAYSEFRKGLLRHISMEEKIVLPAIATWQGGQKAAIAARLRRDHSAIVFPFGSSTYSIDHPHDAVDSFSSQRIRRREKWIL